MMIFKKGIGYLFFTLCLTVFLAGCNVPTSGGYAPMSLGGKTIYVDFADADNAKYQMADFKASYVSAGPILTVLKKVTGQKEVEAGVIHGSGEYKKLSCNEAKTTFVFTDKQNVHPAGSHLILNLKFNSETSGAFAGHFADTPDQELKGKFELK